MPSNKKQKITSVTSLPVHTQKDLVEWGETADASNLERGLLSLPVELWTEILDYFPAIGPYTTLYIYDHSLPEFYLVRIDILRALSQVCIDYRRVFLPLLWDSLNPCFTVRNRWSSASYKHVGDALVRKADGLSANPNLASYIGTVRIIITRYQSTVVVPKLAILSSLQNLHTIQVFHAHPKMTTSIKNALQGAVLPRIHTLILPEHCHEILKCCPQVTKVWCNCGNGSKLVTYIAKYCKEVQEMRGFSADEKLVKRIIKAAPNLRVLEIDPNDRNFETMVNALPSFTNINTIIIKAPQSEVSLDKCIEATKQRLKDLAPSKEKRHIRVWYRNNYQDYNQPGYFGRNTDVNTYVRGYYSEVLI